MTCCFRESVCSEKNEKSVTSGLHRSQPTLLRNARREEAEVKSKCEHQPCSLGLVVWQNQWGKPTLSSVNVDFSARIAGETLDHTPWHCFIVAFLSSSITSVTDEGVATNNKNSLRSKLIMHLQARKARGCGRPRIGVSICWRRAMKGAWADPMTPEKKTAGRCKHHSCQPFHSSVFVRNQTMFVGLQSTSTCADIFLNVDS